MPRGMSISASCDTGKLLRIELRKFPEAEIMAGFERAINRGSSRIALDLKAALDSAIKSPVWPTTEGRADIYETGELMESGSVEVTRNGVMISYDAPYAALVHYGGYIAPYGNSTRKVYLPARPWVKAVLNGMPGVPEFNFAKYYREEIEAEFA